jgi:hypothetical protein
MTSKTLTTISATDLDTMNVDQLSRLYLEAQAARETAGSRDEYYHCINLMVRAESRLETLSSQRAAQDALTPDETSKTATSLVAVIKAMSESFSTLSASDLIMVGKALNEAIEAARLQYRYASAAAGLCSKCRARLSPQDIGGLCADCAFEEWQALKASKPAGKPVEYPKMVCPECGREWLGNDLAEAGTVITKQCGICKNEQARKASQPAPVVIKPEVTEVSGGLTTEIADGTYTVTFADGSYRTLKVKTQDEGATFMPGARIISYLNGPDNWSNYKGFGTISAGNRLNVWRKFAGAADLISAAMVLLSGKEAMVNGLKAYAKESGKCGMCGRKLTTPESLSYGIGPECRAKLGL